MLGSGCELEETLRDPIPCSGPVFRSLEQARCIHRGRSLEAEPWQDGLPRPPQAHPLSSGGGAKPPDPGLREPCLPASWARPGGPVLPAPRLSCRTLPIFNWGAATAGYSRPLTPCLAQPRPEILWGHISGSLFGATKPFYRESFKITK